jgi:hypothetical protein
LVDASIEAVRRHNVPYVDVRIGDGAVVRVPLVVNKPAVNLGSSAAATDDYDDWSKL